MQQPDLLPPAAAAAAVGNRVHKATVKRWLQEDRISGAVIGGIHFASLQSLKEYLATYSRQYQRKGGAI